MFIYNITSKVDHAIVDEWLHWQKEIHIPEIMASGFFAEHRFYKLLEHDDEEGKIFVTQFITQTKTDYDLYFKQFSIAHAQKILDKWDDKVVSFSTLLQNVQ